MLSRRRCLSIQFGRSQFELLLTPQEILLTALLCTFPLLLSQQRRPPLRSLPSMQQ
ncbi:hypothetical protein [Streptomyces sp. NPDC023588]|uniref:hypothetical protein n=1 Tax=Streptomyces sp. NPDC023588 TaxID=3154907 RepID=UPI00340ED225